ncbi:hypothetical protein OIO90_001273 [Microbotryomycetes sp. JL221]|nr:hypothetical protein OIO90_001273 [Microbotryomycetes sp. JL221]
MAATAGSNGLQPSTSTTTSPEAYKTPSTLLCRWSNATAHSVVPQLARTITSTLQGQTSSRLQIQLRPFRMLPSSSGAGSSASSTKQRGRNMYVIRSSTTPDNVTLFIEDPNAPTRRQRAATTTTEVQDRDDGNRAHSRWTYVTFGHDPFSTDDQTHGTPASGHPSLSLGGAGAAQANQFDLLLQRTLLAQPQSGSTGDVTGNSRPTGPGWTPRATAVSLDGFAFSVGTGSGTIGDWDVKVMSVTTKAAAAGNATKGVLVEITYLGVPYLPPGSTFTRNFAASLFPQQALAAGEIDFLTPDHEGLFEAGITTLPDTATGEEPGEYEWTDAHSMWSYVQLVKREGLL